MKITKEIYSKLTKEQLHKLTSIFQKRTFKNDSHLFYEGQTPVVAYLLLEGSIILYKTKKSQKLIPPKCLLGAHHLLNRRPMQFNAKVTKGSTLYFLDTSTIKELLEQECDHMIKVLAI